MGLGRGLGVNKPETREANWRATKALIRRCYLEAGYPEPVFEDDPRRETAFQRAFRVARESAGPGAWIVLNVVERDA